MDRMDMDKAVVAVAVVVGGDRSWDRMNSKVEALKGRMRRRVVALGRGLAVYRSRTYDL